MRESKSLATADDISFDELMKQLEAEGELVDSSQLGEGYHLLQGKAEKKKLVGVPFVVLDWQKNPGKFGGFYSLKIRTGVPVVFNGEGYTKFIVNDGSTGIRQQMDDFTANGFTGAIRCRKGLRVSEDYEVTEIYKDENGEEKRKPVIDPSTGKPVLGTTFYLDTSL
jgi:hypothetical protein